MNWYKAVILPIVFVSMFAVLWQGENWVRWLMGVVLVFVGSSQTLANGYLLWKLAFMTPPEASEVYYLVGMRIGILCLLGLFHLMIGLGVLLLPSLQAFFRYQRERGEK